MRTLLPEKLVWLQVLPIDIEQAHKIVGRITGDVNEMLFGVV